MYKSKDKLNKKISSHKEYSYIEYPAYEINSLNLIMKIILRLLFSSYHQLEQFNEYRKKKDFIGMSIIAFEYFTRKILIK
jgi:hypothetical protein